MTVRKKLKKVAKKIKAYKYRREKDGKIIKVPSHIRIYYTHARKKVRRPRAKALLPSASFGGIVLLSRLVEKGADWDRTGLSEDEFRRLMKRKRNIKIKILPSSMKAYGGVYSPEDNVIMVPINKEGHLPSALTAHELGHHLLYRRHKTIAPMLSKLELRKNRLYPIIIPVVHSTRSKASKGISVGLLLIPELAQESLASYYGYKELKRAKGKLSRSEKLTLLVSPLNRVAIYSKYAAIGEGIRSIRR